MKKLLALLMVVAMLIPCALAESTWSEWIASASDEELNNALQLIQAEVQTRKYQSSDAYADFGDCTVQYVSSEIVKYEGDDCLVVGFDWTNNGEEADALLYKVWARAYQNGIELDVGYVPDYFETAYKNVMPGYSMTANAVFILEDTTPVLIIAESTSSYDMSMPKLQFEISISDDGTAAITAEPSEEPAPEPTAQPIVEPSEEPPVEPTEAIVETIEKGSKGDAVVEVQTRLKELGYLDGAADGIYGNGTASAVSAFQSAVGLKATGAVDAETRNALFAEDAPKAKVYASLDYKSVARDPDAYAGSLIKFSGKILQVMEEDKFVVFRIASKGNYDDVVYCMYVKPEGYKRFLEDDKVNVWGVSDGVYTYTSVMGGEITIPSCVVERIELK